jgi:hypothetical protein
LKNPARQRVDTAARREPASKRILSFMENKTYKLLGADGKFYQSRTKGALGGHRRDKIYGTLDCAGAKMWIAKGHYVKQRVFFADEQTAIAVGFRPCARCLPGKYKEWKAKKN